MTPLYKTAGGSIPYEVCILNVDFLPWLHRRCLVIKVGITPRHSCTGGTPLLKWAAHSDTRLHRRYSTVKVSVTLKQGYTGGTSLRWASTGGCKFGQVVGETSSLHIFLPLLRWTGCWSLNYCHVSGDAIWWSSYTGRSLLGKQLFWNLIITTGWQFNIGRQPAMLFTFFFLYPFPLSLRVWLPARKLSSLHPATCKFPLSRWLISNSINTEWLSIKWSCSGTITWVFFHFLPQPVWCGGEVLSHIRS